MREIYCAARRIVNAPDSSLAGGFSGEIALRQRAKLTARPGKSGQMVTDLPWNGTCVIAAAWTVLSLYRKYSLLRIHRRC
jgi:hypothetical protein